MPERRHRARLAAVLVATAILGALAMGPLSAQTDTTQPPGTEAPATTAPPSTEAPATTAPPGTVAPADSTDEIDVGTLMLLIVVGLAIAAIIGAVVAGRGKHDQTGVSATATAKRDLLANVRWLHDQLSIYLMSGPGPQSSVQWQADRYRVQTMAATAEGYASGEAGGAWHRLSVAIADVVAALDSATALRADPNADPAAVSHAIGVVNQNRALLMQSAEVAGRTIA
ncbi:MAG: hypothetical protein OES57_03065 [Acidimicrobiia bacterium]|nr:hypothetical protein [Acidimicrobiia bacterium]